MMKCHLEERNPSVDHVPVAKDRNHAFKVAPADDRVQVAKKKDHNYATESALVIDHDPVVKDCICIHDIEAVPLPAVVCVPVPKNRSQSITPPIEAAIDRVPVANDHGHAT